MKVQEAKASRKYKVKLLKQNMDRLQEKIEESNKVKQILLTPNRKLKNIKLLTEVEFKN